MVNVTSQNPSPNLADVQLQPSNPSTSRYLANHVGQIVTATVVETKEIRPSSLSSTDITQVKKQTIDTLLAATSSNAQKPSSVSPGNQINAQTGVAQQNTAKSASYNITLNINGTNITVQSPLAPRLGQLIDLEIISSQKLQIINLGKTNPQLANSSSLNSATKIQTSGVSGASRANNTQPQQLGSLTIEVIHTALRESLPKQTPRNALQTQLTSLLASAQPKSGSINSSAGLASNPANPNQAIAQALNQYQASFPAFSQLIEATTLRNAINNSGVFLESQLLKQFATLNSSANVSARSESSVNTHPSALQIGRSDSKASLLKLIHTLAAALQSRSTSSALSNNPSNAENLARPAALPIEQLWQLLTSNAIASRGNDTSTEDGLTQLLRLALGNFARIQSNQLLSLNSQMAFTAEQSQNQTLAMELPYFLNEKLALIDFTFEREKANNNRQNSEKTWNVRLRFDLDEHGELTAFATLQGKNMAATLWVSETAIANRFNDEFESLAENLSALGLNVQQLKCCVGEPPTNDDKPTLNLLDTIG